MRTEAVKDTAFNFVCFGQNAHKMMRCRKGNSIPAYRFSKTSPFSRSRYYDRLILALCYSW